MNQLIDQLIVWPPALTSVCFVWTGPDQNFSVNEKRFWPQLLFPLILMSRSRLRSTRVTLTVFPRTRTNHHLTILLDGTTTSKPGLDSETGWRAVVRRWTRWSSFELAAEIIARQIKKGFWLCWFLLGEINYRLWSVQDQFWKHQQMSFTSSDRLILWILLENCCSQQKRCLFKIICLQMNILQVLPSAGWPLGSVFMPQFMLQSFIF